jgi:hypothetical protein
MAYYGVRGTQCPHCEKILVSVDDQYLSKGIRGPRGETARCPNPLCPSVMFCQGCGYSLGSDKRGIPQSGRYLKCQRCGKTAHTV